jgi:hypothetical protein
MVGTRSKRSRRELLTAGLAATTGVVAQAALGARPVGAATGDPAILGVGNNATSRTIVRNSAAAADAVAVMGIVSTAITGTWTAGVVGRSNASGGNGVRGESGPGSTARGVWGTSPAGRGVYGEATNTSGSTFGVFGIARSDAGTGVFGSGGRYGVRASGGEIGVYSTADTIAVQAAGNLHGVYATTTSTAGAGVFAAGPRFAVRANGGEYGVYGISDQSGVFGEGGAGVAGLGTAYGVHGASRDYALYGQGGSYGAYGQGSRYGVWGWSINGQAGHFSGDVQVLGDLTKSGGGFLIDHPGDPANRTLAHSFVEAPERLNVYRGTVTLNQRGGATVRLPPYDPLLNRDHHIQLTAVGAPAPNLHVARAVRNGRFAIAGGAPGQAVYWIVTGVRKDAWARTHPLRVVRAKKRSERGRFLNPTELGQPRSSAIDHVARPPRPRRARRVAA